MAEQVYTEAEREALELAARGSGRVDREAAQTVRRMRAREQWERYDTVIVGNGAADQSKGWFNTFTGFANVQQLSWFQSRDANVDLAYTNQRSERLDYAQDLYNLNVEYIAPSYLAEFDSAGELSKIAQALWTQELPKAMSFEVLLADSDIIAQGPGTAFMSGRGNAGMFATDSGASVFNGGNNGLANRDNGWSFPEPIMLAAQAKITVRAYIAQPIKDALRALIGPGSWVFPNPSQPSGYYTMPQWFSIRVSLRGPRYMQLRGARSAS